MFESGAAAYQWLNRFAAVSLGQIASDKIFCDVHALCLEWRE
jgi:hypothetical protein